MWWSSVIIGGDHHPDNREMGRSNAMLKKLPILIKSFDSNDGNALLILSCAYLCCCETFKTCEMWKSRQPTAASWYLVCVVIQLGRVYFTNIYKVLCTILWNFQSMWKSLCSSTNSCGFNHCTSSVLFLWNFQDMWKSRCGRATNCCLRAERQSRMLPCIFL